MLALLVLSLFMLVPFVCQSCGPVEGTCLWCRRSCLLTPFARAYDIVDGRTCIYQFVVTTSSLLSTLRPSIFSFPILYTRMYVPRD